MPNKGQISWLPKEAVVESYAYFSHDKIVPALGPRLGRSLESIIYKISKEQQLTLEASVTGDAELAFEALLLDNLVNLPIGKSRKMFSEMLQINKKYCVKK